MFYFLNQTCIKVKPMKTVIDRFQEISNTPDFCSLSNDDNVTSDEPLNVHESDCPFNIRGIKKTIPCLNRLKCSDYFNNVTDCL